MTALFIFIVGFACGVIFVGWAITEKQKTHNLVDGVWIKKEQYKVNFVGNPIAGKYDAETKVFIPDSEPAQGAIIPESAVDYALIGTRYKDWLNKQ
jgi:hypothetical protein